MRARARGPDRTGREVAGLGDQQPEGHRADHGQHADRAERRPPAPGLGDPAGHDPPATSRRCCCPPRTARWPPPAPWRAPPRPGRPSPRPAVRPAPRPGRRAARSAQPRDGANGTSIAISAATESDGGHHGAPAEPLGHRAQRDHAGRQAEGGRRHGPTRLVRAYPEVGGDRGQQRLRRVEEREGRRLRRRRGRSSSGGSRGRPGAAWRTRGRTAAAERGVCGRRGRGGRTVGDGRPGISGGHGFERRRRTFMRPMHGNAIIDAVAHDRSSRAALSQGRNRKDIRSRRTRRARRLRRVAARGAAAGDAGEAAELGADSWAGDPRAAPRPVRRRRPARTRHPRRPGARHAAADPQPRHRPAGGRPRRRPLRPARPHPLPHPGRPRVPRLDGAGADGYGARHRVRTRRRRPDRRARSRSAFCTPSARRPCPA